MHLPEVTALLIEDSGVDRSYVRRVVSQAEGIHLNVAESWSAGMRMLMIADLLIVDLNLPDVPTEAEAVDNVCRLASTYPIVVYSGADSTAAKRCLESGVVAFLRKDQTFPRQLREALELAASRTSRRQQAASHSDLAQTIQELRST